MGLEVLGPGSCFLGPGSWILGSGSCILGHVSWVLQFWALCPGPWSTETLVPGPESSTLNPGTWVPGTGSWGPESWVLSPESCSPESWGPNPWVLILGYVNKISLNSFKIYSIEKRFTMLHLLFQTSSRL